MGFSLTMWAHSTFCPSWKYLMIWPVLTVGAICLYFPLKSSYTSFYSEHFEKSISKDKSKVRLLSTSFVPRSPLGVLWRREKIILIKLWTALVSKFILFLFTWVFCPSGSMKSWKNIVVKMEILNFFNFKIDIKKCSKNRDTYLYWNEHLQEKMMWELRCGRPFFLLITKSNIYTSMDVIPFNLSSAWRYDHQEQTEAPALKSLGRPVIRQNK